MANFRPNMAGIRSVTKGAGGPAELGRIADGMAVKANASARRSLEAEGRTLEKDAYKAAVDVHRNVAVGRVYAATKMGVADQARNHTLNSVNH